MCSTVHPEVDGWSAGLRPGLRPAAASADQGLLAVGHPGGANALRLTELFTELRSEVNRGFDSAKKL